MARAWRLAGAIVAESEGRYWLVGDTKQPCDWPKHGFAPPPPRDPAERPYVALETIGAPAVAEPWLEMDVEGEALARALAARFVIARNGSISERLWRLVTNPDDALDPPTKGAIDARWLGAMPERVWGVVRDAVLKCT